MKVKKLFFAIIAGSCLITDSAFAAELTHIQYVRITPVISCTPAYYNDDSDTMREPYILIENSSTDYLTDSDIDWMTPTQLRYAKNEIYARHGRKFKDKELQEWFDSQEWYDGYIEPEDFDESVFSEIEKENILTIQHQLDTASQYPKTSDKSKTSESSTSERKPEKQKVSKSSGSKSVSQKNKKEILPSVYTMFNCQYPKDVSTERNKVLKKVQELNNKITQTSHTSWCAEP